MRIPVFKNESEAITYHTNMYYEAVGEDPSIRVDEVRHMGLIADINVRYHKALRYVELGNQEPTLYFNKYENCFLENIDYLTGIFRKKKEREALSEEKKKLFKIG